MNTRKPPTSGPYLVLILGEYGEVVVGVPDVDGDEGGRRLGVLGHRLPRHHREVHHWTTRGNGLINMRGWGMDG